MPVEAGRGCITVGTMTGVAVRRSWRSVAWAVGMAVLHCRLHSRSLHSRHLMQPMGVLVVDRRMRAAQGMADLIPDAEVEGTAAFGMLHQSAVQPRPRTKPDLGTAATAVAVADTVRGARHMTVVAQRFAGHTGSTVVVVVGPGSRHRSRIAAYHTLTRLGFQCNSYHCPGQQVDQTECSGTYSMPAVGWERGGHTWHQLGCRCLIASLPAYGHSIGQRWRVWRADPVKYLTKLALA